MITWNSIPMIRGLGSFPVEAGCCTDFHRVKWGVFLISITKTSTITFMALLGIFGGLPRGTWAKVILRISVFICSTSIYLLTKSICLITHLSFSFPNSPFQVALFTFYTKEMRISHPTWTHYAAELSTFKPLGRENGERTPIRKKRKEA